MSRDNLGKSPDFHVLSKDGEGKVWFAGSCYSAEEREDLLEHKRRCYPSMKFAPVDKENGVPGVVEFIKALNKKNGHESK